MPQSTYSTGDRRPIAARNRQIFQRMAAGLAGLGVTANMISIGGLVSGVAAGICLFSTNHFSDGPRRMLWFAAAVFIQLRLLANMLDGMVAVATGKASPVGELYNEIPDRISDAATLIGAGYAAGGDFSLGYIAACMAILTAYVRAVGKVAGAPQDYCGPMAKQQRMAIITLTALFCGIAPVRLQGPWYSAWSVMSIALLVVIVGATVTVFRRLSHITANLKART